MKKLIAFIACMATAMLLFACASHPSQSAVGSATGTATIVSFDRSKSGFGQSIPSVIKYNGSSYYLTNKLVDIKNSGDVTKIGKTPQGNGLQYTLYSIRGYVVKKYVAYRCVLATHVNYFVYASK